MDRWICSKAPTWNNYIDDLFPNINGDDIDFNEWEVKYVKMSNRKTLQNTVQHSRYTTLDPEDEGLDLNLDKVRSAFDKPSVKPMPVSLAAAVQSFNDARV